jgi:hypothetical protein
MPSQHELDVAWLKEDVIHHAGLEEQEAHRCVLLVCSG